MFLKVMTIVFRYVPNNASMLAENIVFGFIALFTFCHLFLFLSIIITLRRKKNITMQLKVFFVYSFVIVPIFRSCSISITARHLRLIIEKPSMANFFLSACALLVLSTIYFMTALCTFALGSSPSPRVANPLAIWAPNTWENVQFDILVLICMTIIELECNATELVISILLIVRLAILFSLIFLHIHKIYFLTMRAYEFVSAIFLTFDTYLIFLIILSFKPNLIPYWILITLWCVIPVLYFSILKAINFVRVRKTLVKLKKLKTLDLSPKPSTDSSDELLQTYTDLNLGKDWEALFAVRIACVYGLDCFANGSLLRFVMHTYESLQFNMLYMSYFIPDNLTYVKSQIDSYLSRKNPSLVESAIIFQLITSIQESSNELSQEMSQEISKQILNTMKCEQFLSKFWAGCYKGDISQMSRSTYNLYQNLADVSEDWKQLVVRYPYSIPLLVEYLKFLIGIGSQHKLAESILSVHPKLNENILSSLQETSGEINNIVLHESIEAAVDRRPILSFYHVKLRLLATIICAFLFNIAAIILAFIFFAKCSGAGSYLYYSDTTCNLLAHSVNLLEKIETNATNGRETFFNHSKQLDLSITNLLKVMPDNILRNSSDLDYTMSVKVNEYQSTNHTGMVKFLRLYSYYSRSVAFVPYDDDLVNLMRINTFNITYSVFLASNEELYTIQRLIQKVNRFIPFFYGSIWAFTVIIMIPLIFSGIQRMKSEMKYIFNLYLTIPRSVISEFMEQKKSGNNNPTNLPNQFVNSAYNLAEDKEKESGYENINDNRAIENLKLLVHDQSSTSSVIPTRFVLKIWFILFGITFMLLISATVEVVLFTDFVSEIMLSLRTLQYIARRTLGISVALQGILSNFTLFPYDYCQQRLQATKDFNSILLLATDTKIISKKFLSSDSIHSLVHDPKCTNQSDICCWSFANLIDYFFITTTKMYNDTYKEDEVRRLSNLYNDLLYPLSYKLHENGYYFILNQFTLEKTILLSIFFVVFFVVLISSIGFVRHILHELDATIAAVKLPMKYIPPIKVPDLPRIMQYLQGEADWRKGSNANESKDERVGNYLNIIEYPHALFEEDKTLLYANPPFYNLIGAPREACIGLSLEAIFSRLMNFITDQNHPFNQIIKFFDTKQSQTTCVKISTSFERPGKKSKNVEIRTSIINGEDGKHVFMLNFEDLSNHDMLEEMSRYERQLAESLKHNSIAVPLLNALSNGSEIVPKRFSMATIASFSISYASARDEYDGQIADGCSLFLRSQREVGAVFPSIVLLQQEPPQFSYLNIPDESDAIDVQAIQMVHFINAIINSFNSTQL